MNNITVNSLLKSADNEHLHRILWIADDSTNVYLFDTTTMSMPELISYAELQRQVESGVLEPQKSDPFLVIAVENDLSEKERAIRDRVWAIMEGIVSDEPRIFIKKDRGAIISAAMISSGKDLKTLHRYLKLYWQRGKTKNAFLPQFQNCGARGKERSSGEHKRGRPRKYGDAVGANADDAMKANFESATKKYYHNRGEHTLQYAYDMMIKEHYISFMPQSDGTMKAELLPEDKIPTLRQFCYWYTKKHNVTETIIKRKGESKFALEHRAVMGKSDYGVMGPGAVYQIDATIGDIYLVSRFNRADIIGRPVIYFVIDVSSRMVTGMYVGLEGPSWAGAMMALTNAICDKVKYCAEFGVTINEEEWPCRGVPGAIRADRGEMESSAAETLINALGVRIDNTPPYRADLKGIVEQYFNTINGTAVAFLPGHVKPDMSERGGKDYRLDAKLDIQQLTKILIQCVLQRNNHHLLEGYERTEEMIADEVVPIPITLWNWGITHTSGALRSFPEEVVKLSLMPADTALVTENGIRFKGLYYLCERAAKEYWLETARAKGRFKVNISYDPRNMGTIYVRNADGTTDVCWLSEWQDKYTDKCLHEIVYLRESEKLAQRTHQPQEMASKADLSSAIDSVIAEAEEMARQTVVPKSKSERTKNIRANRASEKEQNRKEEAFVLGDADNRTPIEPDMTEDEDISPTMKMILKDLEERLNGGS